MRISRRQWLGWALCALTSSVAQAQPAGQPGSTVLVVGDSLSGEYGLPRGEGWVAHLAERLKSGYPHYQVSNASISGDTTSGGLSRLPQALKRTQPSQVVIALGSNDALRGLPLDMTARNLAQMITLAREAGAGVLLVGMRMPPNYGPDYTERFEQMFTTLASEAGVALVPFLMEGIALDRAMFQADGIHPNSQAQPIMADNVWQVLQPLLRAGGGQ